MLRFELSDRVHLRFLEPRDADELHALTVANQAHLAPWMPWAAGEIRREDTVEFIRRAARQWANDDGFQCTIVRDGRLAGNVGLHRVDWVNGTTSIGYWLAEDAQGRGIMTAAVWALLSYAFGPWGLHRVVIQAAPENTRSRAIPERLGFTQEGVLREVELVRDRRLDWVVYGLLAPEWRGSGAGAVPPSIAP